MTLEDIKTAVDGIKDDKDLFEIVRLHGLKEVDRASRRDNILSEHTGVVDGIPVLVRFSWHDPSQAFSIQPDIHKVELVIGGQVVAKASYVEKI